VAKIQTDKFIGAGSKKSPVASAVKKNVLATNNLNITLKGVSSIVNDLYKIELGFVKVEKDQERADRRNKRRAADQAAEDKIEARATKAEGKKGITSALKKTAKKGFAGAFGFISQLLAPIGSFLAGIGAFAITSEIMKWIGDPENAEKLQTFLDKALFVFDKIFGWVSGFTINIIDGWSAMFAEDGDFGSRLRGLGDMMKGIIGLRYLMNPFALITDILSLLDLFDRDKPDIDPKNPRPKGDTPDGKPKGAQPRQKRTGLLGALDSARDRAANIGERFRTSKFNPFADRRSRLDRYYDDALGIKPTALDNLRTNTVNAGQAIGDEISSRLSKTQIKGKPVTEIFSETVDSTLDGLGLDKERRAAIKAGAEEKLTKLRNKGSKLKNSFFGGLQTLQRNLTFQEGSAFRKGATILGQEVTFAEGSNTRRAATITGDFLGRQGQRFLNAVNTQYKRFDDWASGLPEKAKNAIMNRILRPIMSAVEPVMNTVKGIGGKLQKSFMALPFVETITKALAKKNIKGLTDIKGALKEIGPYAWPIIGSIFSLVSSYDRLTNQDPTGALIDAVSGLFELSVAPPPVGLAFVPGSGISTFLDIAMLGRDLAGVFFPEFDPRTEEDKLIANLGLGGVQNFIKSVGSKLPKLSALGAIFGQAEKEGPKREDFEEGEVGDKDYEEAKQAWLKTQPNGGKTPARDAEASGDENDVNAGAALGGLVPFVSADPNQEFFLGGVVKGIGKAVSGIGKTVSKVVSNPLVQTAASFIPGAAPIMAGIGAISGLASGNPMGAIMQGVSMIPGMGGMMSGLGGVMDKVGGFINSPLGQMGTSLLQGNFLGAANIGLGMIGGPLGNIGSSILGGNLGGAISTGLGMVNPALGQLAGSVLSGGFNPMNIMTNVADHFGLGGVMSAVTGAMGGDPSAAIKQIGGELGIDPKILGAVDKASTKALGEKGISAKFAMEQALEFVPIPMVLEKLVPIMTAVPINTGGGQQIVQAVESTLGTF